MWSSESSPDAKFINCLHASLYILFSFSFVSFFLSLCFPRVTSHRLISLWWPYTLTTEWAEWKHWLAPVQRWHLTASTGTRPGPEQLNASEALPCVGSRTPSSTRPAPVVWVAGPGRYGRDAERSHGTCDSHRISLLKYETEIPVHNVTSRYSCAIFPHTTTNTFTLQM